MQDFDSFEIAMLIKDIYSKTTNIIGQSFKDSGLTHQQIMIIKLIAHKGKVNISELCTEMSLSKGTVSGIVARLEANGYIERFKEDGDKRNTYVRFAEKGTEFAKEFRVKITEGFDNVFKNLSKEELSELKSGLKNLRDKIKE